MRPRNLAVLGAHLRSLIGGVASLTGRPLASRCFDVAARREEGFVASSVGADPAELIRTSFVHIVDPFRVVLARAERRPARVITLRRRDEPEVTRTVGREESETRIPIVRVADVKRERSAVLGDIVDRWS